MHSAGATHMWFRMLPCWPLGPRLTTDKRYAGSGLETVQLAARNDANGQALRFEVRFGSKAVSAKLNTVPESGMIQVNMDTQM